MEELSIKNPNAQNNSDKRISASQVLELNKTEARERDG